MIKKAVHYTVYYIMLCGVFIFLADIDNAIHMSVGAMISMCFGFLIIFVLMYISEYMNYSALKRESLTIENSFNNDCLIDTNMFDKIFNPLILRNRELKELLLQQERFSTVWVHDIKLPLATLQLFYNNNLAVLTKEQKSVLSHLLIEFEDKIIQRMQIDKLSQIDKDFKVEKIQIESEVNKAIKQLSPLFIMKNISIVIDIDEHPKDILSDRRIIHYALVQVLSNSLNYSKDNSEIKISGYVLDGNYRLSITDHGVGISASDIGRVFEFGYTGSNGRTKRMYASSGVGLHIVKKEFDYLGHNITIESTLNIYTTVYLDFKLT